MNFFLHKDKEEKRIRVFWHSRELQYFWPFFIRERVVSVLPTGGIKRFRLEKSPKLTKNHFSTEIYISSFQKFLSIKLLCRFILKIIWNNIILVIPCTWISLNKNSILLLLPSLIHFPLYHIILIIKGDQRDINRIEENYINKIRKVL